MTIKHLYLLIILLLPAHILMAAFPDLGSKVDLTTGTNPQGIQLADIDGDKKPDMIIANTGDNTISVYRNISVTGSITAGSFAAKVDFATGSQPTAILVADLDRDNKPEIVVTNYASNTISLFRNMSTTGSITNASLAPKADFATDQNPVAIAAGSLNGDGSVSLAVACPTNNRIDVFDCMVSSGNISLIQSSYNNIYNTVNASAVAFADVDNDGGVDLVIANTGNNKVVVYKNDVDYGHFSSPISYDTGVLPVSLSLGDTNGDGNIDIIVVNKTDNTVSLLLNTGTGFASKVDFATGNAPVNVQLKDLDRDGRPDLIVSNYDGGSISILKNTGGSFAAKTDIVTGTNPAGIASADIDGDAVYDIAVTNSSSNNVSLFRNLYVPPVQIRPTITAFSPESGPIGTNITVTGTDFPLNSEVYFGDIKGITISSSPTQVVVKVPPGAAPVPFTISSAYSKKPFRVTFEMVNRTIKIRDFYPVPHPGEDRFTEHPMAQAVADFNGDGLFDLAGYKEDQSDNSYFNIFINNGSNDFADAFGYMLSVSGYQLQGNGNEVLFATDMTNDGKPDIVVNSNNAVFLCINTTVAGMQPTFSIKKIGNVGAEWGYIKGAVFGDINNDGKKEIVIYTINDFYTVPATPNHQSVLIMESDGTLTPVLSTEGNGLADIADMDGDGKLDLVVSVDKLSQPGQVYILKNNIPANGYIGSLSFAAPVIFTSDQTVDGPVTTTNYPWYKGMDIDDLDSDGLPDIAIGSYRGIVVYKNQSTPGTINTSSLAAPVVYSVNQKINSTIKLLDLNSDGRPEIISKRTKSINGSSDTYLATNVFTNNATKGIIDNKSFTQQIDLLSYANYNYPLTEDMNADGKYDLIVGSTVFLNKCPLYPVIETFNPPTGPVSSTAVTIRGINFNPDVTKNTVYFGATRATVQTATSTKLLVTAPKGATYKPISVLNTDYKLTGVSSKIFVSTFSSTSTNFDPKVTFPTGVNPKAVAIGDLDGDRKADMVVINAAGTISIYRNTSTSGSINSSSFAAKVDYTLSAGAATAVAIADLNGDGKPDIVVTSASGARKLSLLTNHAVSGVINDLSFKLSSLTTILTSSYDVAVADINGDGSPDLITQESGIVSGSTVVRLVVYFKNNSSDVAFSGTNYLSLTEQPGNLTMADFNQDNFADFALANSVAKTASVYINTDINSSYYNTRLTTLNTAASANIIKAGDIDGDGRVDLVMLCPTSNLMFIYRNTSLPGTYN
ncbi:MAG: FG-GAP-like repeat-containing protein, partial [Mucilaginibacter sp.]|uniref:FG-GAP-like repeat-containing protein n=1 Tax=Mucilaginibacter sp. TaxID=1882438 RepID=UPI0031ABE3B0